MASSPEAVPQQPLSQQEQSLSQQEQQQQQQQESGSHDVSFPTLAMARPRLNPHEQATELPSNGSSSGTSSNRMSVVAMNRAYFEQRAVQLAEQEAILHLHKKSATSSTAPTTNIKGLTGPVRRVQPDGSNFISSARVLNEPTERTKSLIERYTDQQIGIERPLSIAGGGGGGGSSVKAYSRGASLQDLLLQDAQQQQQQQQQQPTESTVNRSSLAEKEQVQIPAALLRAESNLLASQPPEAAITAKEEEQAVQSIGSSLSDLGVSFSAEVKKQLQHMSSAQLELPPQRPDDTAAANESAAEAAAAELDPSTSQERHSIGDQLDELSALAANMSDLVSDFAAEHEAAQTKAKAVATVAAPPADVTAQEIVEQDSVSQQQQEEEGKKSPSARASKDDLQEQEHPQEAIQDAGVTDSHQIDQEQAQDVTSADVPNSASEDAPIVVATTEAEETALATASAATSSVAVAETREREGSTVEDSPTWRESDELLTSSASPPMDTSSATTKQPIKEEVYAGHYMTLKRMPRRQEKTDTDFQQQQQQQGQSSEGHGESGGAPSAAARTSLYGSITNVSNNNRHSSPFPGGLYGSIDVLSKDDTPMSLRNVLSGTLQGSSNTLKRRTVHFPATLMAAQKLMQVVQDHTASSPNQLSVTAGEVVLVTNPDPAHGYWLAKRQGDDKEGLLPKTVLKEANTVFSEVLHATAEQVDEAPSSSGVDSKEDLVSTVDTSARVSVRNSVISTTTTTTRRAPQTESDSWWSQIGSKLPREEMMRITRAYRQRQETIYELVTTQRSFVQDMEMTWTWFVQPLRECVNEMTWRQLFSNLDKVIDTHRLLSTALLARADTCAWNFDQVGDILIDKLPNFKLSAIFCSHFALSLELLAALKGKPEIAKVYEEFSQQPYFNSLNPEAYLLAPMQRVSKFNILIRAIIGTTDKEHADYAMLEKANSIAANVLFYINTECGKAQEWQRLQKLQVKLGTELQDEIGASTLDPLERELQHVTEMGYGGESKKISVYTFSDTVLMLTTRSNLKGGERLTLYRQPLNINLTEFVRADNWDARTISHRFTRKESDLVTSRMILVYENVTDALHELYCVNAKERDTWLDRIRMLQRDVLQSNLFRYKQLVHSPLPTDVFTSEWTSAATIGDYNLLAANETVYLVPRRPDLEVREMVTFKKKRVQQIEVHQTLNLLITVQGKQQSVVTYDLDAIRAGIDGTYRNKVIDVVGTKLPGSKNVRFFRINDDDPNTPTLIAASGKHFSTYTFSRMTKVYKKSGEFELSNGDSQDCTDVTFIKAKAVIALGSDFYLADQKTGTFNVMPKPYLQDTYYGTMQAITCIQLAAKRFLMCYDNAAFITDHAAVPLYDWAFEWQAPLIKCEVHDQYVLAYMRHFVEVWDLKSGVLQQVLLTPEMKLLSRKEEGLRVCLEASMDGLPILGHIEKGQSTAT